MKIYLKAIHTDRIKDIVISQLPFIIGRDEKAFRELTQNSDEMQRAVAFLSKKHAKIFISNGHLFISDYNSTNGTKVNGVQVGNEPVRIHHGDIITLGKKLAYHIEKDSASNHTNHKHQFVDRTLEDSDPDVHQPAGVDATGAKTTASKDHAANPKGPIYLKLQPLMDKKHGVDTIIIDHFPFSVGRDDPAFIKYKKSLPHNWRTLSRKHALITCHHNKLFIQDCKSLNGTTVKNEKLTDKPVTLGNGDEVAFGGFFRYKTMIITDSPNNNDKTICSKNSTQDHMADKTAYLVDSPTNFAALILHSALKQRKKGEQVDHPELKGRWRALVKPKRLLIMALGLAFIVFLSVVAFHFYSRFIA